MKNIPLVLVFLSLLISGMAQERENRDYRAELDLQGSFPLFALAPDGTCWLTSGRGKVYYTDDIHSDWHCASPLFLVNDNTWITVNQLSFIDTNTAIAVTYDEWGKWSHCYRTENHGKSWFQQAVSGDVVLRQVCTDAQGHIWLTGSGKEAILYYSEDHGVTFTPLERPVISTDWVNVTAFDMRDGQYGLAGVNIKHDTFPLMLTEDNWRTSKRIPSPLGESKEINKVLIWNDLWVIRQGREVYYSSSQNLQWQRFPITVTDFYPDRERGHLIAITDNLNVVDFSSPTDYRPFTREPLPAKPAEAAVYHGTLYVWAVGCILCKVDENGVIVAPRGYTTEEGIEKPYMVRDGSQQLWGVDFRNTLCFADKSDGRWYRKQYLPMDVETFKLLSDSVALFWDGQRHYTYSLADGQLRPYTLSAPLEDFLKTPITEVVLCGGLTKYRSDTVRYTVTPDIDLQANLATLVLNRYDPCFPNANAKYKRERIRFRHTASRHELDSILRDINRDYTRIPNIADFQITEIDRRKYYKLLDELDKKDMMYDRIIMNPQKRTNAFDYDYAENFYQSVPDRIDTLSANTVRKILYKDENWRTTGGVYWFEMQIVNSSQDTLRFTHYNKDDEYAWFIPWLVEYNGIPFRCYSIALSRWISACLPEKFYVKGSFDNARFLLQIADYLWKREE